MAFFRKDAAQKIVPVDVAAPFGPRPARTPVDLVKKANGSPAVDLTKVRELGHVELAKRADKAGVALNKRGLSGIRAQAVLVLDHSGSMSGDYRNGSVQTLVERALGFALQIDTDGSIEVLPFDFNVKPVVTVTIDNYQGVVDRSLWNKNAMGSTNLTGALQAVLEMAKTAEEPLFIIVATDGEPDDARSATRVVCELASYACFIKFLSLRPVVYLDTLDNLGDDVRLLDNCNAQPKDGAPSLLTCTDLQFAEAMAEEWDEWMVKAKAKGVLA